MISARARSEMIESGLGFPNRRWSDSSFRPDGRPAGMPEPLSMDLRTRVLAAVADGASGRRVGGRFGVSAASVSRWRALERTQGDASPKAVGGDRRSQKTETHAPAMIGCGHVSGLEVRLCHMPRAGMEIRRPGADQNRERLKPVDPNCFSWPRPVRSVCPYRSSTSLIADAPAEAACRSGRRQR